MEDDEASEDEERQLDIQIQHEEDNSSSEEDNSSSEEDNSSSEEDDSLASSSEEEVLKNLNFRNVEPVVFDIPTNFSGRTFLRG